MILGKSTAMPKTGEVEMGRQIKFVHGCVDMH